jgi:glycosyltransferase involved in cell wall biosynthesis
VTLLADERVPFAGLERARLAVFCDYYGPTSTGGSERVAREVNRRLAGSVAQLTVLTAQPRPSFVDAGVGVVRLDPIDLSRVLGAQFSASTSYYRTADRALDHLDPNVLCTHSLHFHGSIVAARLARRRGIPLVSVAHVGDMANVRGLTRHLASAQELAIGRWILRSSSAVIAVSEAVRSHSIDLGADPSRVIVVPNGVDHTRFHPTSEPEERVPHVVFVGRLIANKGPMTLVEATQRLMDRGGPIRVTLVGDGPLEEQVRRASRGLPISVVGRSDDVPSWIRRATVVVRPSLTEGMPLAVLEAMASCRCVVASNIDANRVLIKHGSNGLLHPPGDAAAFADVLQLALTEHEMRRALAEAGHATSLRYSWDETAEGHRAVLADACRQGASRRAPRYVFGPPQ